MECQVSRESIPVRQGPLFRPETPVRDSMCDYCHARFIAVQPQCTRRTYRARCVDLGTILLVHTSTSTGIYISSCIFSVAHPKLALLDVRALRACAHKV